MHKFLKQNNNKPNKKPKQTKPKSPKTVSKAKQEKRGV